MGIIAEVPTRTTHGYPVLAARWVPGDAIQVNGWFVVAHLEHNPYHPFVTWFMRADDLSCHGGDYCETLEEALQSWKERR